MTGGRVTRRDATDGGVPRRPRRSRTARPHRRAATSLAAGTLLIVAAVLLWAFARPTPAGQTVSSVGASGALELTVDPSTTPAGSAASAPAPASSTPAAASFTPAPASSAPAAAASAVETPPAPLPPPLAPPAHLRIPALAVDAPVAPVGVTDDGEVQVPVDVGTVGWYRFGPAPGALGSAVLIGHVDDVHQGVGVLARIGELNPGDLIEITDSNGDPRTFSVVAREQWAKADAPLTRLFDRGGSSRLVLVTCGGAFDHNRLQYTDNIAVTAVPVTG